MRSHRWNMVFDSVMRPVFPMLFVLITLSFGGFAFAADEPVIAVGIFAGRPLPACSVSSQSSLSVLLADEETPTELPEGVKVTLQAAKGRIRLLRSDRETDIVAAQMTISAASPLLVNLDAKTARAYRGALAISIKSGRLLLVNQVELEDYLRGVVPAEMPAGFAPEALKAQAIAARTYTLANLHKHGKDGFNLCDGVHCQVYLGVGCEKPGIDTAVSETAGLIVTYDGQPISAVYHDTCGGCTASSEEVWATNHPTPYLRSVDDHFALFPLCSASPHAQWTRRLSQEKLAAALAKYGVTAPLKSIRPQGCEDGTKPDTYQFVGVHGAWTVPAGAVRTAMNLPSTDFIADFDGDTITLTGWGNGHGVGLCQWGANGWAKLGKSAEDILTHYYTGTKLEVLGDTTTMLVQK